MPGFHPKLKPCHSPFLGEWVSEVNEREAKERGPDALEGPTPRGRHYNQG